MENTVNYAALMLKISEYQGPDFILGIFTDQLSAEQAAAAYPTKQFFVKIEPLGIEIISIQLDRPLDAIGFAVSKYVEGFGQTMRESLHVFDDKDSAKQYLKKLEQLAEDDPDESFPEYFLLEEIPLNQLRDFQENTWLSGEYGEYLP